MIEAERGRELPGPPAPPLHSVENRCPLGRSDVRSHIFIHPLVGSTVETSNVESLFNSEVVFERSFVLGVRSAECLWAFNGSVAMLHVLGESGMRPFASLSGFHVLAMSDFEAPCCFSHVRFLAGGADVSVHSFACKGVCFRLVF